jgi:hypothetical protein
VKKLSIFLITALLAATPAAARIKYVAVVETDVDAQSGASDRLNPADVRLITAELRREAVKNLPRDRYSIMTSETVQAQGGAVLEACADENCVVTLGSKIGADYIVRGTISKFQKKFALTVEMYETENGTLAASSDPVRSEKASELLEKAAAACAGMFKAFAESQNPGRKQSASAAGTAGQRSGAPSKPESEQRERLLIEYSWGGGAFFASDFGSGLKWSDGERLGMPYYGGGAYLFFDLTYMDVFFGYSGGGGKWESPSARNKDNLPDMQRSYLNMGFLMKYPIRAGSAVFFPLAGIDCGLLGSGKLVYKDKKEIKLDNAVDIGWIMFGGGADFDLGEKMYWRVEAVYGWRFGDNDYERAMRTKANSSRDNKVETVSGNGLSLKVGLGVRLF